MPPRVKKSAKRPSPREASVTPPPAQPTPTTSRRAVSTFPWSEKVEDKPFDLRDARLLDYDVEGWDKDSAAKYNQLLPAEILPTRFADTSSYAPLGLDTTVFDTLQAIGIQGLCNRPYELYPDLVRQVLATAQLSFENPVYPTYETCRFTFMADGKFCTITLDEFNELYDLPDDPTEVAVDKKFVPANALWDLIANGQFTSRKAYQSLIRNPSLRILAKIISNVLFAKEATSKVTAAELQVLYVGIEDELRRDRATPLQSVNTNPGFHLLNMFCERGDQLAKTKDKTDRCGSLLTPLFFKFNIDVRKYKVVSDLEYVDTNYLMSCHILRDESTYQFTSREGETAFIKLPLPGLTDFSSLENIRFHPDPDLLCADPRDANMADVEDVTPPNVGEFDLDPHLDLDDDMAYRKWMVDSQRKNNSLMKKILHAITGGCFSGQSGQAEPTTPGTRRPGKEPVGTSAGGDRLPRNRRLTGEESGGSE